MTNCTWTEPLTWFFLFTHTYVPLEREAATSVTLLFPPATTGLDAFLHPGIKVWCKDGVKGSCRSGPGEETEGAGGWVREVTCLGVA